MAKGIVIFFFLLGVGIFLLIRLAGIGLRGARDYVRNFDNSIMTSFGSSAGRFDSYAEDVARVVNAQRALMNSHDMADFAKDEWSVGYVAGLCETLLSTVNEYSAANATELVPPLSWAAYSEKILLETREA